MGVLNYENTRELVMQPAKVEQFEAGFKSLRGTLIRHGFAQEAVDALQIKVTEYMMTVSAEEHKGGAFHIHGDGQPFYAIEIETPGNIMELSGKDVTYPTKLSARDQATFLMVELSSNIFPNMGKALEAELGNVVDRRAGGCQFSFSPSKLETTMRCEPNSYCQVLNKFVDLRLKMIVPQAPAPGTPGRTTGSNPNPQN